MRLVRLFILSVILFSAQVVFADCVITSTLKIGSKSAEVECLQIKVGTAADGKFGPLTKLAVMTFQSNNRLVADGIVGPLSRAVLNRSAIVYGVYPSGCISNVGYSQTTGVKCDNGIDTTTSPSSPSLPTTFSLTPVISKLSTTNIQNGEAVTIYGKNFTQSNTVLLSPIDFPNKYTGIVSTDGTSIKIIPSPLISETLKNTHKNDSQTHRAIIDQIKSVKSEGTDGWYLSATISVVNENGTSNAVSVKVNILNGV